MDIKPLADRILVIPDKAEEKTSSGLFLPEGAKDKPNIGTVIAVGEGKITDSGVSLYPTIEVGNKILYGEYSGISVTLEREEYLIMKESDVFAVIEDEKPTVYKGNF